MTFWDSSALVALLVAEPDTENLAAAYRNDPEVVAAAGVAKTNRIAVIEGGESLLGRVVNALGRPIDGGPHPENLTLCPIDRIAPPLLYRDYISNPLYTGIKVIDAMLAIGRGQRALIVGDHASGKTALAVDTLINQKTSDVISIYVSIGQSRTRLLKTIEEIKTYGEPSRTVILAADSGDSVGFQFLAPYSATAVAEFFMDRGRDVLIVYDDLSKHADAYRSLSLLLKRPPGREAFPGRKPAGRRSPACVRAFPGHESPRPRT